MTFFLLFYYAPSTRLAPSKYKEQYYDAFIAGVGCKRLDANHVRFPGFPTAKRLVKVQGNQ